VPEAEDEACRRYYESNPDRFRSPDIFEASHILFPAPPGDEGARAAARAAAEATLKELERDPEAFARLAKERSADSATTEQGGALGQITRGQTTPEFEACLSSLAPGETCREPVETRFGFHVIRLDRARRGRPLSYAMVRERVAEYLHDRAWSLAVRQYMKILIGKASIEGIALEGASTPLVQ
jgi:peptidyl-prolyl cis-trans isomerase C